MTIINCPLEDCAWVSQDLPDVFAGVLAIALKGHIDNVHPAANTPRITVEPSIIDLTDEDDDLQTNPKETDIKSKALNFGQTEKMNILKNLMPSISVSLATITPNVGTTPTRAPSNPMTSSEKLSTEGLTKGMTPSEEVYIPTKGLTARMTPSEKTTEVMTVPSENLHIPTEGLTARMTPSEKPPIKGLTASMEPSKKLPTKGLTESQFEQWKSQLMIKIYQNEDYEQFLNGGIYATWNPSEEDPGRITELASSETPEVEDVAKAATRLLIRQKHLNTMLAHIASGFSKALYGDVMLKSTSLESVWDLIEVNYGLKKKEDTDFDYFPPDADSHSGSSSSVIPKHNVLNGMQISESCQVVYDISDDSDENEENSEIFKKFTCNDCGLLLNHITLESHRNQHRLEKQIFNASVGKRKQELVRRRNAEEIENPLKRIKWKFDKKVQNDILIWEGFIIFSQFKAGDNPKKHGWNFDESKTWNPYKSNIKQVSMYLQILESQSYFSQKDMEIHMNTILNYLPYLRGKEMPKLEVEEDRNDIRILYNCINRHTPKEALNASSGTYQINGYYYNNLSRYNCDIWTCFVIYYGNHGKEDPFLAEPYHVKEFIMTLFDEPESSESVVLENYPDFYWGNAVNICKNLDFYLKYEYGEKSLLDSKAIQDLHHIFHSLDQKLNEPAGLNRTCKGNSDLQRLIPKFWYVNNLFQLQITDKSKFWYERTVYKILMDVKNRVLSKGDAAWELGVTIDMIDCALQKMRPEKELRNKFASLTINQYVKQRFGSEEKFWKEVSTEKLISDLQNRVANVTVDTVAFELGTSSAAVMEKAGRIKTAFEVEEERCQMMEEKRKQIRANAPPTLTPLELEIQSAEKNESMLSDYEKLRLNNLRDRLSVFNDLEIVKDKKALDALTPIKPQGMRKIIVPRKKSSRIKNKESLKVEESQDVKHGMERQSPLWVGKRTPKRTVVLEDPLSWEIVDTLGDQLSQDELSAIIPVPKMTLEATDLIASQVHSVDYDNVPRFLERLESEIAICGREEKLKEEVNISNWINVGGGKGSNDEIISMAMSEELIAFGDMGGGLGFWLGEKPLLLRPHNMPVIRTFFTGSGSSTSVVTTSHDGTIRVFDASKLEFSLAYSWDKQYKYKQGVVWLEPVDQNLWLVSCEEGDFLNLDRRDRKINKILSLPKSRRSCQSQSLISQQEAKNSKKYSKDGIEEPHATPGLVGSNIAIHPIDTNRISLCDDETVLVYDRRNFQQPISTIKTFERNLNSLNSIQWNSILSHHCGSSWSPSGKHFATCERKWNQVFKGRINLYSDAQLTDDSLVAKRVKPSYIKRRDGDYDQIFNLGQGVLWSPWQEDVCYFMDDYRSKKNKHYARMVIGVDVNSGDVVGELGLPADNSNMMGFHPSRPQIVVANLNETGDVAIYKEEQE